MPAISMQPSNLRLSHPMERWEPIETRYQFAATLLNVFADDAFLNRLSSGRHCFSSAP
jgi:hypothetical protein